MVNPSLVRYAASLKARGVSRSDAKAALERYGYPSSDCSAAVQEVYGGGVPLPLLLIVIAVAGLLVLFFVQSGSDGPLPKSGASQQASLSIEVQGSNGASASAVPSGESILVTATITLPQASSVTLIVMLSTVGGTSVFEDSTSRKFEGVATKRFSIPTDGLEGEYLLKIVLSSAGKKDEKIQKVVILPALSSEPSQGLNDSNGGNGQIRVPSTGDATCGSCISTNACTLAQCIDGECVLEEKTSCCGNFRCEADTGETSTTCSNDCRITTDRSESDVRADAVKFSLSQPDRAKSLCSSLSQAKRNRCLSESAAASGDETFCDIVTDEDGAQSECYISLVLDPNFARVDLCNRIKNFETKDQCIALRAMLQTQKALNISTSSNS